jgi:type I restriction enzyme S subunit
MTDEFPMIPLRDVATVRSGFAFKSSDWRDEGIPVVKIANVKEGRLNMEGCSFVAPEVAVEAAEFDLARNDILIAMTGYIGDVAWVREYDLPVLLNQRVGRFAIRDDRRLHHRFLFYLLRSPEIRSEIAGLGYGSAQPNVSPTLIQGVKVPLPSLSVQQAIACILGALDDKIELNRRMNETLEGIAQAIFKSWFVDAIRDGLPEGWRESTIGEEIRVVGGSTPSTSRPEFWEGGRHHWATPKDLANLSSPILLDTERKITDAGVNEIGSGLLPVGTLLLSSRAPIGYLAISEVAVAVNQGFIAMVCDRSLPNHFVRLWVFNNMELIEGRANGTTFLEISKKNFRPLPIEVPPQPLLEAFQKHVDPIHRHMVTNLRESLVLAALRDALLPKLISGELHVPDAERIVGRCA